MVRHRASSSGLSTAVHKIVWGISALTTVTGKPKGPYKTASGVRCAFLAPWHLEMQLLLLVHTFFFLRCCQADGLVCVYVYPKVRMDSREADGPQAPQPYPQRPATIRVSTAAPIH